MSVQNLAAVTDRRIRQPTNERLRVVRKLSEGGLGAVDDGVARDCALGRASLWTKSDLHRSLWSFLVLAMLVPLSAHAQNTRLEEYRQAATEGQDAFNRGEFAEARERWQHARGILPNPRIYRLLGRVAEALNEPVEAVRMYRLSLTAPENDNPLTDARRQEVEDVLLPQAMAHVGEILLEVEPADAVITIDGRPADIQDGSLLLPVGTYTLRIRRQGYVEHEQSIEIQARAREPLRVELRPEDGEAARAARASGGASPGTGQGGGPDLTGPIVLFGIAGAGLVTFAVGGGLALAEDSRLQQSCFAADSTPTCAPSDLSELHLRTAVADAGWIIAAAAGIAGVAWLAIALSSGGGSNERAVRVSPWASADGGGVVLGGTLGGL